MSPHAVAASTGDSISESVLLKKFGVTPYGFLPAEAPLQSLSDPYFAPWELLIQHLPQLIQRGRLRDEVSQLPVLSPDRLGSEAQWRRAYVILAFLTHGYIWGGEKAEEILPPSVSIPFLHIADRLELPPVLSYAASNLWNFGSTSPDFSDLDSIRMLHTFTGTESEQWFFMVSVAMEAQAAPIIPKLVQALEAVKVRDYAVIIRALQDLIDCIRKLGALLERMYEKCDPMVFYYQIRPFLAGSKNMEAAGLPRGVFYDEADGKGEWMQLRGGSNGQSSLIQFLDVVLGIEHTNQGNRHNVAKPPISAEAEARTPKQPSFHEEIRAYMPGPHRRFLLHASRAGSIRGLAQLPAVTPHQEQLRDAYTTATRVLSEFRDKHIQIVTRYIVIPSRHPPAGTLSKLKTASSGKTEGNVKGELALTGTGGTLLMPFLKQARDETSYASDLSNLSDAHKEYEHASDVR